ncbi:hypothetical protein GCM10010346_63520 [Streptomyces chryseus]|uniref:Uncharacterized protein n=1 Tax=Streptomyces chryseus TaxID=68186 RepID=A0ABQ3EI17_9ACTN|nr:hypothetical protein GCM10010346_63520 [Streptomyces chryseus]
MSFSTGSTRWWVTTAAPRWPVAAPPRTPVAAALGVYQEQIVQPVDEAWEATLRRVQLRCERQVRLSTKPLPRREDPYVVARSRMSDLLALVDLQEQLRRTLAVAARIPSQELLRAPAADDQTPPSIASSLIAAGSSDVRASALLQETFPGESLERAQALLEALVLGLRRAVENVLGMRHYEYTETVPRHEKSPCGVLRMASPIVPRAPQSACAPAARTAFMAA